MSGAQIQGWAAVVVLIIGAAVATFGAWAKLNELTIIGAGIIGYVTGSTAPYRPSSARDRASDRGAAERRRPPTLGSLGPEDVTPKPELPGVPPRKDDR